ncbi:MAG: Gfo/Idh/MocA family oxidoreductase [Candidatus Taylorbacteria bacterium]
MQIHKQLKIGVVGLGHQSIEDHIPAIKASKEVKLVGVVEVDKDKLNKFTSENIGVKGFTSLDDMVKEVKPDILVIAIPHNCHYEATIKAIEHKIHILKEKPLAVSLDQARMIRDKAIRNNVNISVTLQRRFNPIYSTFLQLIDKIGDPFYIDSKYTIYTDHPEDGWRGEKRLAGGGCILDMGYHMVDLLMWYFGLPDKVFAETSCNAKENIEYDAEDTAQIMFRYNDKDIWGSMLISRVIFPKQEYFNVYGTRGYIHLERGKIERFSSNGVLQEALARENSWPSASQDQIEYFVKVIRGEKENISGPENHFSHLAFIEAAYKSKESGRYYNPKDLLK